MLLSRRAFNLAASEHKLLKVLRIQRRALSNHVFEHTLSPSQFEYFKCPEIDLKMKLTRDELLDGYKQLNLIRLFELTCDQLYKERAIRGFCHLSTGQEAIPVGIKLAGSPEDSVITSYRCHGMAITRGLSSFEVFAELIGKKTGSSKGKGGSMHIYGPNFYGGNGIVGAQVPLGAGIALANKYLRNGKATFAIYGDGAANQGQVYEAFNMSKLWNISCVFICENNVYGMGTSTKRSSADTNFYNKCTYIPGFKVDALDLLAFKQAITFARNYTLENNSPIIIEASTYRYFGHSVSDPGTSYRDRDEISQIRKSRDVINKLKLDILNMGAATEDELKQIAKQATNEIKKAKEEALNSPFPDLSDLTADIYTGKGDKRVRLTFSGQKI